MSDKLLPSADSGGKKPTDDSAASKKDDLADYVTSNLDALRARFGDAEEDERIRGEGFELAKKSTKRKTRRQDDTPVYGSADIRPKDDIRTDSESELSKVFDSAKSEYDSTVVSFGELELDSKPEQAAEPPKEAEKPAGEAAEEPPKKKRGRPRKNPLPVEAEEPPKKKRGRPRKNPPAEESAEEPAAEKTAPAETDSDEEVTVVRKFNTHTRVIYVDDEPEDGIKRNSDDELEGLFASTPKGRRKKPWALRKKK